MRNFLNYRWFAAFVAGLGLAVSSSVANAEAYTFTLQNLTRGQHFTPPLFIVHTEASSIFTLGAASSTQLEMLAEGGMTPPLEMLIEDTTATLGVAVPASGRVDPGKSVTVCVDTGSNATFNRLSLAGMMLPTNDGFVGLNAATPPAAGASQTWYLNAYDAGTEENNELVGTTGFPKPSFLTSTGTGGSGIDTAAAEGYVHIHRGVLGDAVAAASATGTAAVDAAINATNISDINAYLHRWVNPVARVTVAVATGACPSGN